MHQPGSTAMSVPRPSLTGLSIADPPELWCALGFTIQDHRIDLGSVELTLGGPGHGITGWAIHGLHAGTTEIDGLSTVAADHPDAAAGPGHHPDAAAGAVHHPGAAGTAHPNGAIGLDHVVIVSADFDRTAAELERVGLVLRRVLEVGAPPSSFRQGFRRIGPAILELVEAPSMPAGPARFWGLVAIVDDLDTLAADLGSKLSAPKPAVQAGRRIATLRQSAGLSTRVGFMTPPMASG